MASSIPSLVTAFAATNPTSGSLRNFETGLKRGLITPEAGEEIIRDIQEAKADAGKNISHVSDAPPLSGNSERAQVRRIFNQGDTNAQPVVAYADTSTKPMVLDSVQSTDAQPVIHGEVAESTKALGVFGQNVPSKLAAVDQLKVFRGGTLTRSVDRGIEQSQGLFGQLMKATGDATGFASMVEVGDELIQESFVEAIKNPGRIHDLSQIDSLRDANEFFWQTLGEQIPNLALAATGAGTGAGIAGYAARAAVTRTTLNNIARRAAAKGLDPIKLGTKYFALNPRVLSGAALKTGAAAGAFGAFFPVNTGEILQEQRDAGVEQPSFGPNLALGAASTSLEILGFGLVGKAIFGKAKKEVVETMVRTVLRRIGHASLKSLAAEGGTEAVQEVLVIASRKIDDPTFSITDAVTSSEGLSRIAFAGVSGMTIGGFLGGVGGVATGIRDAGVVGLKRADIRGSVNTAKDALDNTFRPNESGEVESLFDLDIARQQMAGMVSSVKAAAGTAVAAIKNNLSPQDQAAATAAAQSQQGRVFTDLEREAEVLDGVEKVLERNEAVTEAAVAKLKRTVEQLETPASGQERTPAQHAAVKKTRDEIKVLLDKGKKASAEERAALSAEMLAMAEKLTSKALTDPLSVPVDRVRVLTNAAGRHAKAGYKQTRAELKKSRNVVNVMKNQTENALKDLPAADMDIAGDGITTSTGEILRSVAAVAEGKKTHAFAVGSTLSTLPAEVKVAVREAKLQVKYDGKQVIIANRENINKDAVVESFATPVEEVGDDAVAVTARDEAGGQVTNEAVPNDPNAIAEAAERNAELGEVEIRHPDEVISEGVQDLVDEVEAIETKLTIGAVEEILRKESQLYARVAVRNKKTGKLRATNRLIEVTLTDENSLARDDVTKPFALFDNEEQIQAASELATSKKKFSAIAPLDEKGNPQIDKIEFDTVTVNGQLLLLAKLSDGNTAASEAQIRRAIHRGNSTPNKEAHAIKGTRDGSEVFFHLGEVTRLGVINTEGSTNKFDMAVSAQAKFLDGLYTLMLRGYKIDFQPARDGDKIIFGNLPYKEAPWLAEVLTNHTSDEMIDAFNEGDISAEEVAPVLWGQGAPLSEKEIIDILTEAETIVENVGTDPSEVHVVETKRKENRHKHGLSGTVAERLNSVAFPEEGTAQRRELDNEADNEFKVRSSIMDEPVRNPVLNNARGFILNTPSKPSDQVQNFLVGWPAAGIAVQQTLEILGIKEQVVLFDEHSAAGVLSMYNIRARTATSEEQRTTFLRYSRAIQKALDDDTSGRIITPPNDAVGEDRMVHVFVAKNRARPQDVTRGLVLMHEMGHLVQYTHLDRLSPELKQAVLDSFPGVGKTGTEQQKRDAFANWMTKVATDLHFGRKVRAETEVDNIFVNIVKDLKEVWTALKGKLGYHGAFNDFVAALNAHTATQRGERVNTNKLTKLGAVMYLELQTANAGAYIPDGTASYQALDMDIDATVEQTVERANDSVFGNYVDNFQEWASTLKDDPRKASKMLIYTADAELRGMGPVGLWLAKQFHAIPSSTDPSNTVFREIMMRGAQHFTKLNRTLNGVPGARISLWESMFNKNPSAETVAKRELRNRITEALLKQSGELDADIRPHVESIREYLEGLYGWYTDNMGMPLKHQTDYYPLMFDTAFLEKHRGRFERILQDHGFSEKDAKNIRMKITRDEDGGLTNGFHEDVTTTEEEFFGPGLSASMQRAEWTKAMRDELIEAGFYQKDIATTLIAYTEMLTRRAVWARRFKDEDPVARLDRYDRAGINPHGPVAKLQLRLHLARERGDLNEWQYNRIIKDILPAYAGQLGLKTNAKIRKLSAGVVIYQNIRLLAFAIFAQFVDVGTLMSRGEFKDTQAAMRILMNKTNRDEAMIMLEAIGAYRQGLTEHVLNDQALNTFMTGNAKRINDLFFRYNGMEGWTNLMRVMGLVAGREFIQRNARKAKAGDKTAQRYMDELSLGSPEMLARVIEWDGTSTKDETINAALNRFIDEAMIRPDPTIRPVWMSDPGYGIFAHLKGFLYGFHETFLRRVGREAKIHQNLLPLLALGMLALPFAAVGYELRRKLLGSKESPEGMSYMKELIERAGLFGAFQMVVDMEQADEYGKPFALGIGGPAVEQLFDFFDRDLAGWVPRATPIVSSSPVLRDWMRDTISFEE